MIDAIIEKTMLKKQILIITALPLTLYIFLQSACLVLSFLHLPHTSIRSDIFNHQPAPLAPNFSNFNVPTYLDFRFQKFLVMASVNRSRCNRVALEYGAWNRNHQSTIPPELLHALQSISCDLLPYLQVLSYWN